MIQRKQTLYLLISAILLSLMPFFPMAQVSTTDSIITLTTIGFETLEGKTVELTVGLFVLNIIIVLISFFSIFIYKRRVIQMRLTIFNLLLKIGLLAYAYFTCYMMVRQMPEAHITPRIIAALPFIAIIFDYLAHRGIAIDDKIVRYMDRLR